MPFGKGGQDPREAARKSAEVRRRGAPRRAPAGFKAAGLTRAERLALLDDIGLNAPVVRDRINALSTALRFTELGEGQTAEQRSTRLDEEIGLEHGRSSGSGGSGDDGGDGG